MHVIFIKTNANILPFSRSHVPSMWLHGGDKKGIKAMNQFNTQEATIFQLSSIITNLIYVIRFSSSIPTNRDKVNIVFVFVFFFFLIPIVITSEVERDSNLDSPHKGEKVMSITKLQGCQLDIVNKVENPNAKS